MSIIIYWFLLWWWYQSFFYVFLAICHFYFCMHPFTPFYCFWFFLPKWQVIFFYVFLAIFHFLPKWQVKLTWQLGSRKNQASNKSSGIIGLFNCPDWGRAWIFLSFRGGFWASKAGLSIYVNTYSCKVIVWKVIV